MILPECIVILDWVLKQGRDRDCIRQEDMKKSHDAGMCVDLYTLITRCDTICKIRNKMEVLSSIVNLQRRDERQGISDLNG
jgi:hypothetical protein